MPLPGGKSGKTFLSQYFSDRCRMGCDAPPHMRKTGVEIRNPTHANRVMIAAGHQARPGWRAQGRGVKIGETHTVCGQAVDIRGFYGRAVTAEVGKSRIVKQNQDHIRASVSRTASAPATRGWNLQQCVRSHL